MQSASTLLALAGLFAAFTLGKKSSSKPTSSKESSDIAPGQIGSKDIGYKINDCKLTIYDKQKALDYAFKLGVDGTSPDYNKGNTWSTKPLKKKLVGDCISSEISAKTLMNTKEKALFVFELFRYLYSGIALQSDVFDETTALDSIQQFKDNTEKLLGYDTSDFKVELIQKS